MEPVYQRGRGRAYVRVRSLFYCLDDDSFAWARDRRPAGRPVPA